MKIVAYQFSEQNNISEFKQCFPGQMLKASRDEILWGNENNQFIYLFKFGVVCFLGYNEDEINLIFNELLPLCTNPLPDRVGEVYQMLIDPENEEVGYYKTIIKEFDYESVKLVMLNLAQSVTLTYYKKQTELLLEHIQKHTSKLEKFGNFKISMGNLKKFIGKALTINNRISENLYLFDSPPNAWNNEYLNKLDQDLKQTFKTEIRTKLIKEDVHIVKENLDIFTDLLFHRKGEVLEWIVILLITFEVVKAFFE